MPKNFDIITKIESQALRNMGIFGTAGSGKSVLLRWLAWIYSNAEEMARYSLEPINVFAFNYHRFQRGHGDFEGLEFSYVNIYECIPDLFNPEYKEFLIRAFSVVFVSILNNVGIMASMLSQIFREVLDVKPYPRNWDDFERNAKIVKERSDGFKRNVLEVVLTHLSALKIGNSKQVEFDFSKPLLLDFAYLPTDEAKAMYSEFYANLIYDKAEKESVAGRPHSIMLVIDEAHRLLKYSRDSIVGDILVNGRKHLRTAIATQNTSDVHDGLFHFQWFQFRTSNAKDIEHIKKVDELHGEAVKKLNEKEFVWINDGSSLTIPVFKLDITRLEEFRTEHPQVYDSVSEEKNEEQTLTQETEDVKENTKYDKEKTEKNILDVVEASPTGLFVSQVLEQIGYGDRNDSNRGTAFRLIKKMAKDGRLRIKDYISADKRVHKLVFSKSNPQRAETQVHKRLRDDIKKSLDENQIPYTESEINQGYDFETEKAVFEVESGLKNSLKEWNEKIMTSKKLVITILCNEEDRQRYSYLPCVEAGKTKLVLLSERGRKRIKKLEK